MNNTIDRISQLHPLLITCMRRVKLLKLIVVQHLLRSGSRPWTQGQIGNLLLLLLLLNLKQLLMTSLPVTAQVDTMLRFSSGGSGCYCGGCCCPLTVIRRSRRQQRIARATQTRLFAARRLVTRKTHSKISSDIRLTDALDNRCKKIPWKNSPSNTRIKKRERKNRSSYLTIPPPRNGYSSRSGRRGCVAGVTSALLAEESS